MTNLDDTRFFIDGARALLDVALASLDPSYNEADPLLPNPAIVADCGIDVEYERTAPTMLK